MKVPVYDIVNCGPRHQFSANGKVVKNSSLGLQVHNFRRDAFSPEDAEFYKRQMLLGDDLVDRDGRPVRVMDTLGKMLRSAIIPEEGNVLVVGDWNAVESRMTAYLAGQDDKIELFREGGDPYCHAASMIYGREITPEDVDERQIGKVVDLSCGFLGGPGALQSMATAFRLHIPVDQGKGIVDKYRRGHKETVDFGNKLQRAALNALTRPGKTYDARGIEYTFNSDDRALYCRLLDGETVLRYPECRVEMDFAPWDEDKSQAKIPKISALQASFSPGANDKEWARHGLWRGLFLENVAQASCAKILRDAGVNCEEEGLDVIFHVHDELVLEVPEAEADAACRTLRDIMNETPSWAPGLPLKAEPVIMARYGK